MKKIAFALIRTSTSDQDTLSQKNSLCKIANNLGYEIDDADIFEEKVSGYDEDESHDRISIIKLEEQILLRKPDAIFVWELSRLTRRAIKVQRYIDRLSVVPKVPMYFADYDVWTLDPKTRKTLDDNIMILVGGAKSVEIERERIKARTSRGRDAKAEQGFFVGHLADGYTWKYQNGEKVIEPDLERSELIETIFKMYVEQEYSTGMIRDVLNAEIDKYPPTNRYRKLHPNKFRGYKDEYRDRSGNLYSRDDMLWTDAGISQILRDEWYKGTRYYHGKPYAVQPLVNVSLWEKAQERLESFRFINHSTNRKYLLTGRLYCGKCGRKMYGHGDGYSNMYYCSSKEYGTKNKCGLRWLRQENVDSIVFNIVKARAAEDITYGQKSVFSDFFETDSQKAREIDAAIKTHNKIIKRAESEIEKLRKELSFFIKKQGSYIDNPKMMALYDEQIEASQKSVTNEEKLIQSHTIEIDKLKKKKKLLLSIADKLSKVSELTDFDNMRALLFSVISKIVVYNPDTTSSVIRIKYVNGEYDDAIYNPTRLQRRFIFLSQDYQKAMKMRYDDESKQIVFNGYYLALSPTREILFDETNNTPPPDYSEDFHISLGTWNTSENRDRFERELKQAARRGVITKAQIADFKGYYEKAVEDGIVWNDIEHAKQCLEDDGFSVYKDSIPVKEYVNSKRADGALFVYDYADLLPMTEAGIARKNWHREYYRKKYNTGKPTFTEFVEKGVDYDRICKERKHLYNRKYKILNNKHLTDEQKEAKILKIMEQLEAYKYQLKYLPNNKKGEAAIKKYNNKSKDELD